MFILSISVFILLHHLSWSACEGHCPIGVDITPCDCEEIKFGRLIETTVSCRGAIGLPRLTSVLQKRLCGHHVNKLRLVGSDISYLPSNLFYMVKVDDIAITTTNISHFTEAGRSAFYGLERSLKSLAMRSCSLVDGLRWKKIGELHTLDSLDLSKNDLTTVPHQWFRHPPRNLKNLYLNGNKISNISSGALSAMHKLMLVDLSENVITSLERDVFPYPGNSIIILKLSYNKLTTLAENFFDEMFGLRRLYLDHNRLQTLDSATWKPIWNELKILDIMGNDFACDCSMGWVSQMYPIEYLYGQCSSDSHLSNRELKLLWPWDFNCSTNF